MAEARAAFEERRRYGLAARHRAKLAYSARRAEESCDERENEEAATTTESRDAA